MTIWRSAAFVVALFATGATGAAAQDNGQTEDEIVVTGQRLEEILQSFVGEVSVAPSSENQLARWDRRICPGVVGMRNVSQAQFMVDRLAQRALAVGLRVGEPGCRANVLIFVTPDSTALARQIADQFRSFVGYYAGDQDSVTQGQDALTDFVETQRPVRWWHVSQTVTEDGQVLGSSNARPSASGGLRGAQVARVRSMGRLERTTRQDFNRVLIIVDAREAAGLQFDALADYVAMVALAQLDPDADTTGFPTILNLFAERRAGRTGPAALTDWDEAYLEGLYEGPRNARNTQQQEGAIARSMEGELTQPPQ